MLLSVRILLGGGPCTHPLCDGAFEVIVDDGLGTASTDETLRAEATRVWDAGGWSCGRCATSFPLTDAVLEEWLVRELACREPR